MNKNPLLICCLILTLGTGALIYFKERPVKAFLPTHKKQIGLPPMGLLQSGDLVLRHGKGFVSKLFLQFSLKDPRYSHAGLLSIEEGQAYVYHAIGGEENQSSALRKDLLINFCSPLNNYEYGLYRYLLTSIEKAEIIALTKHHYKAGLQFDTALDLNTDDKMYCSEFIYKMLKNALPEKNIIPLSVVSGRTYVAIDNLYQNPYCKAVYMQTY